MWGFLPPETSFHWKRSPSAIRMGDLEAMASLHRIPVIVARPAARDASPSHPKSTKKDVALQIEPARK